ncbi:MAG: hypothetical protein C4K58_03215 [Flavobacteriaceae bacterium]|nr:MAG: hypothetical protein C4K58_03215 [Flavobacteriaceae bacterium]
MEKTLTYQNNQSGQSSQANSNIANFANNTTAYKYYRYYGGSTAASGGGWATEFFFKEKVCTELDTDTDGKPNRLDLDSDGDKCSDLIEAGVKKFAGSNLVYATSGSTSATGTDFGIDSGIADAQIDVSQSFGSNGLANYVETSENGITKYLSTYNTYATKSNLSLCKDTDGDGYSDVDDLDDDNDGILDTTEGLVDITLNTLNGNRQLNNVTQVANATLSCTAGKTSAGSNVFRFNINWNNTASSSDKSTMTLNVNGVDYLTISTPSGGGTNQDNATEYGGDALITAFNGATFVNSMPSSQGNSYLDPVIPSNPTFATITVYLPVAINTVRETFVLQNDDFRLPIQQVVEACQSDTDKDGIVNHLDLDTDGDSCPDAMEGAANIPTSALVTSSMDGGNNNDAGLGYNGTSTSPVVSNLGNTVGTTTTTLGVPTVATTGQAIGDSQNGAVKSGCTVCYKKGDHSEEGVDSHVGISTLDRTKQDEINPSIWPEEVKNGQLVLESKDKGFIITHTTPAAIGTNAKEGMIIYDTSDNCIKLYDGTTWGCIKPECDYPSE